MNQKKSQKAPLKLSIRSEVLATCPRGMSSILAKEMEELGYEVQVLEAGVVTEGNLADCVLLNLALRTAHRVMYKVADFHADGPEKFYKKANALPWERWFSPDGYFSVSSRIRTEAVNDSMYAALLLKDAVVDRFRAKTGRRPDSGRERKGASVFLYWSKDRATVYLDTTGEPLSRRGYRKLPHKAPMQETLAAAALLSAGWEGEGNLVNPMCGSGTLAIEGALIARNASPGIRRRFFSFMALTGYDERAFQREREAALDAEDDFAGRIIATDRDKRAIEAARKNARAAGVEDMIEFRICDFRKTEVPEVGEEGGLVILNPEYGMRLGEEKELVPVYKAIGDFFKQECAGYTGAIFTGNIKLGKQVGLRTSKKIPFWNAKIECRLLVYELYAGKRE